MFPPACAGMGLTQWRGYPLLDHVELDSTVLRSTAPTSVDIAGQIHSIVSSVATNLHGAPLHGQWDVLGAKRRGHCQEPAWPRLTSLRISARESVASRLATSRRWKGQPETSLWPLRTLLLSRPA
jgi:hypothetical protein